MQPVGQRALGQRDHGGDARVGAGIQQPVVVGQRVGVVAPVRSGLGGLETLPLEREAQRVEAQRGRGRDVGGVVVGERRPVVGLDTRQDLEAGAAVRAAVPCGTLLPELPVGGVVSPFDLVAGDGRAEEKAGVDGERRRGRLDRGRMARNRPRRPRAPPRQHAKCPGECERQAPQAQIFVRSA